MSTPKILVTGATGTIGSQIAAQLTEHGIPLRAAVRVMSRAVDLHAMGAEVVAYDIEHDAGVEAAFEGVERAFILTPFVPGFEALTQRAIAAAQKAGVHHIVKLSAAGADANASAWLAQNHGRGDVAVMQSGLSYTILRPTFFQDNVLNLSFQTIAEQGTFSGASKNRGVAYVSSSDVAAVAVQALLHPEAHANKTYTLTGREAVTGTQLATLLSEAMGRTVTYADLPREQYAETLRSGGTPEPYVDAFLGLEDIKAQGLAEAVSPDVAAVLGREPETYPEFIRRNQGRLPFGKWVGEST